jgi:hypothetical protein
MRSAAVLLLVLLATACATVAETYPLPAIDRLPADFVHDGGEPRDPASIDMIVIHTVGGPSCVDGRIEFTSGEGTAVSWRDWFLEQDDKSIHYVVDREGRIAQQRPEARTAGHVSYGGVMPDVNKRSIGIELVNRGDGLDPFPETQIEALIALVQDIAARNGLTREAIWTHQQLDTRRINCAGLDHPRNVDPGPLFPLERLKAALPPA